MGDWFSAERWMQIWTVETAAMGMFATLALLVVRIYSGIPKFIEQWIAYKRAKAEEKAAEWTRLRDHCNFLMEAEERCQERLRLVESDLAILKGYAEGQGSARQEAAGIVALERAKQRSEPRGGK